MNDYIKMQFNPYLDKIERKLKEAEAEYFKCLNEWEENAKAHRLQSDMYGWNFAMGMRAGACYVNIYYYRVSNLFDEIRKELESDNIKSA